MYIVTGGAGFIGSNLVRALADRGCDNIVVVDDLEDGHKFVNISDLPIADYMDKDDLPGRLASDAGFAKSVKAIFRRCYIGSQLAVITQFTKNDQSD